MITIRTHIINNLNSMQYADDLIIMSISIYDLQHLVNLMCQFRKICLNINVNKSARMRMGKRHNSLMNASLLKVWV